MAYEFLKSLALGLIGRGFPVPELALSRVQEYRQLRRVLNEMEINCVIDVGANRGQTGRLFRSLGFKGPMHSFEPQTEAFAALEQHSASDPAWWSHKLALGEDPGTRILNVNRAFPEMTSLLDLNEAAGSIVTEPVQIRTLDSLFPELVDSIESPRVLLKIDTEGYDLHVFRGAGESLPHICTLQAEVFVAPTYKGAHHYLEALQEFEGAGFKLEHLSVVSRTSSGDLMCLNCLMSRS